MTSSTPMMSFVRSVYEHPMVQGIRSRLLSSLFLLSAAAAGSCIMYAADPPRKIANWQGLAVWEEKADDETGTSTLVFRNSKGGVLHREEIRRPFTTGTLRTAYGVFFTAEGHSGGESGCCQNLHVFFPDGAGIGHILLESSGYAASITVRDLNGDGIDEIRTDSEFAYGLEFDLPADGKNARCAVVLAPGIHTGMSDVRLPLYYHVNKSKKAFSFEDVTFSNPMKKSLLQEIEQAEQMLASLPRTHDAPAADLAAILQVYRARAKSGSHADALNRLRRLGFSVRYVCGPDGKPRTAGLAAILEESSVRKKLQ